MNQFHWYFAVGAILAIATFLKKYWVLYDQKLASLINSSCLLFHFIFLSAFIYCTLPYKKSILYRVIFLVCTVLIIFCLFTNNSYTLPSNAFAISNLGLVIFCCFYYYQLFEAVPTITLLKEPSFWIITGIFFCMCSTVPILAIRFYLLHNTSQKFYSTIEIVIPFAYGVMHLFFIKAYVCSIRFRRA